jgi:hypothetical protein
MPGSISNSQVQVTDYGTTDAEEAKPIPLAYLLRPLPPPILTRLGLRAT